MVAMSSGKNYGKRGDVSEYMATKIQRRNLSIRLQAFMRVNGISTSMLSKLSGVSPTLIHNYMHNKCGHTTRKVAAIANALQVDIAFLLGYTLDGYDYLLRAIAELEVRTASVQEDAAVERNRAVAIKEGLNTIDALYKGGDGGALYTSTLAATITGGNSGNGDMATTLLKVLPPSLFGITLSRNGTFIISDIIKGGGLNPNALSDFNNIYTQKAFKVYAPITKPKVIHMLRLRDNIVRLASELGTGGGSGSGSGKALSTQFRNVTGLSSAVIWGVLKGERYPAARSLFLIACALYTMPNVLESSVLKTKQDLRDTDGEQPAWTRAPSAPAPIRHVSSGDVGVGVGVGVGGGDVNISDVPPKPIVAKTTKPYYMTEVVYRLTREEVADHEEFFNLADMPWVSIYSNGLMFGTGPDEQYGPDGAYNSDGYPIEWEEWPSADSPCADGPVGSLPLKEEFKGREVPTAVARPVLNMKPRAV
jgi:transcriptional regulator with XRE-family HTH domain